MPVAFSIVKDTHAASLRTRRPLSLPQTSTASLPPTRKKDFITIDGDKAIYHNHWTAGGNDLKWEMVHYDVQLFGGIALHQGKIAEMATVRERRS